MVKRNIQSTTMSPNRGHNHNTITDSTKLKFSDRLKAYLSKDGLRSDASELDDPYTFSDTEVKPNAGNHHVTTTTITTTSSSATTTPQPTPLTSSTPSTPSMPSMPSIVRKSVEQRVKVDKVNKDTLQKKVIKVNNTVNHHHHHHHHHHHQQQQHLKHHNVDQTNSVNATINKSDNHTTGSGKTMSRLQAQIARNKVTVKHNNRHSPDLKVDKNYFDKNTKHSIIGNILVVSRLTPPWKIENIT